MSDGHVLANCAARPKATSVVTRAVDDRRGTTVFHGSIISIHVRIGNAIFVHGGLDPAVDPATALSAPFTDSAATTGPGSSSRSWRGAAASAGRWSFTAIRLRRSTARCQAIRIRMSSSHDRLSLDGGSFSTGIVAAAQLENGRYRLFKDTPAGAASHRALATPATAARATHARPGRRARPAKRRSRQVERGTRDPPDFGTHAEGCALSRNAARERPGPHRALPRTVQPLIDHPLDAGRVGRRSI